MFMLTLTNLTITEGDWMVQPYIYIHTYCTLKLYLGWLLLISRLHLCTLLCWGTYNNDWEMNTQKVL